MIIISYNLCIEINTKMFRSNNTKTTTVLIAVALATVMIIGPQITNIADVLAKQKYSDWEDCRADHSKNWCKNYFKNHDDDDNDGNRASQGIGQSQSSSQNSQVLSGGDSIVQETTLTSNIKRIQGTTH